MMFQVIGWPPAVSQKYARCSPEDVEGAVFSVTVWKDPIYPHNIYHENRLPLEFKFCSYLVAEAEGLASH